MVAQYNLSGSGGLMKTVIISLVLVVLRSSFLSAYEINKCQTSTLQVVLLLSVMDNGGVISKPNDGVKWANEATVMRL